MTRAPANLLEVRSLLLKHLNRDPNRVRDEDLEPAEVGIVGDSAHRGGYHCGEDRVVPNDYSVVESSRDRTGLTLDAAALDVGMFEWRDGLGRLHNLQTFSVWCVAQCVAGATDTRDIREIIYSPDGKVVRRWDRLGRRSTGDRSHLWHTHFSWFRDSIKAGRDQTPLFRRYLTTIGLLTSEDDVSDYVQHGDRNQGVYRLQYRLNRLGFSVGPKGADGIYGDATTAAVVAFEKSLDKDYKGDGRSVNAATWTRLDDARAVQLIRQHAPQPPAPSIDYAVLARALDLHGLAAAVPVPTLAAQLAASPELAWALTNELLTRLTKRLVAVEPAS
ncbi:peptidoglycan-binding protein [Micromonospora sp. NPDC003816]|uniref:peptidoglycan-binding domain-containing protein n=1 Tax=Micromonospora sp. NPDC003816 TaxID=3364224 RepID=UPI003678697A